MNSTSICIKIAICFMQIDEDTLKTVPSSLLYLLRCVNQPPPHLDVDRLKKLFHDAPIDLDPKAGPVRRTHQPIGPSRQRTLDEISRKLRAPGGILQELKARRGREDLQRRGKAQVALEGVVHVGHAQLFGKLPDPERRRHAPDA